MPISQTKDTIIFIIIVFDPVFLTFPVFHFIQCNALPSKLRLIFALCNLQHIDHMQESLKVTTILARKMQKTNTYCWVRISKIKHWFHGWTPTPASIFSSIHLIYFSDDISSVLQTKINHWDTIACYINNVQTNNWIAVLFLPYLIRLDLSCIP